MNNNDESIFTSGHAYNNVSGVLNIFFFILRASCEPVNFEHFIFLVEIFHYFIIPCLT